MGVKVLRRTVGVLSGRGFLKEIIKSFLNLIGGLFMEHANRGSFVGIRSEEKKNRLDKFFKSIGERSKVFYRKHLQKTVNYNHLEVEKLKRHALQAAMMDSIRRQ